MFSFACQLGLLYTIKLEVSHLTIFCNMLLKKLLMRGEFSAVAFRLYDLRQTGFIEREEASTAILFYTISLLHTI